MREEPVEADGDPEAGRVGHDKHDDDSVNADSYTHATAIATRADGRRDQSRETVQPGKVGNSIGRGSKPTLADAIMGTQRLTQAKISRCRFCGCPGRKNDFVHRSVSAR